MTTVKKKANPQEIVAIILFVIEKAAGLFTGKQWKGRLAKGNQARLEVVEPIVREHQTAWENQIEFNAHVLERLAALEKKPASKAKEAAE